MIIINIFQVLTQTALFLVNRFLTAMSTEATATAVAGDAVSVKSDEEVKNSESIQSLQPKQDWPWRKAKKAVVMVSFCGKNYMGMQRYV